MAGLTEADTAVFDTFATTSGTFVATSPNSGTTLTYGISGGTTGGNTVLGGVTYDVSDTSPYGTLYLKSTTGSYTFVPNSGAINTLTTTATENFIITATDGTVTTNQTLAVTLNGANDAPTLAPVTGPTDTNSPGVDHFNAVTGVLVGADVDLPAQTLTYGISGGAAGGSTVLGGVTYDVSEVSTYGTLYLNSTTGAYSFVPNDAAINALTAPTTENFIITVSDGTLSTNQTFTVTLNGANDAPTLAAVTGPTYTDTAALDHFNAVTGVLAGADVDLPVQTLTYGISGGTAGGSTVLGGVTYDVSEIGTYGTLYLNSTTGAYSFVPNETAINALATTKTENFTLTVSDGTLSSNQTFTLVITGTNDGATISGTATGTVKEDGTLTATGTLTAADVDTGENHFQAVTAGLTGTYGSFTFNELTGVWGYTLNNAASNVQALGATAVVHDTLVVKSVDGTATQTIDVTITGTNDGATISGTATGTVKEDGTLTATGTLTAADVDTGENHFQAVTAGLTGTYGSFTFNELTGVWGYTLNNAASNVQALGATAVVHDTLVVKSVDGTATQTIDVTITGTNDGATISGTATGTVKEDGTLTATGTLTAADVDTGENHFQAVTAGLTGTYGSFTFNELTGVWGYTLNNAASNVQALGATAVVHDTLVVKSVDGTATQTIDVTITGTNDGATISGTATGTVKEDGTLTATGTLTAADVDTGENHFQAVTAGLTGTYGSFTFNELTGVWGYTLNNAASNVQALGATAVVHDTLVVKSVDGTATQTIDVTITGTNDGATISGTATGTVKEDGTLTATGTLTAADVDTGENHFQAVTAAPDRHLRQLHLQRADRRVGLHAQQRGEQRPGARRHRCGARHPGGEVGRRHRHPNHRRHHHRHQRRRHHFRHRDRHGEGRRHADGDRHADGGRRRHRREPLPGGHGGAWPAPTAASPSTS